MIDLPVLYGIFELEEYNNQIVFPPYAVQSQPKLHYLTRQIINPEDKNNLAIITR